MSPISGVDCIVAIPGKGATIVPIQGPAADIPKQRGSPSLLSVFASANVDEGVPEATQPEKNRSPPGMALT